MSKISIIRLNCVFSKVFHFFDDFASSEGGYSPHLRLLKIKGIMRSVSLVVSDLLCDGSPLIVSIRIVHMQQLVL